MKNKWMKKITAMMLVAVTVTAALTGCGSKENEPAQGETAEESNEELPEVVWKISHTQSPDHFMNVAMENMAAYVAEQTDGKFTIEVYHSGTLGSEQEVIEGMQMGTIAGNLASVALLANYVPSYNVFSLPGLFKDETAIQKTLSDDELMKSLREEALNQNIMEVGYFQDYFRMVFSKDPIAEVADFEGQKIRVMSTPVLVDTFQALGCNTTTTAWSEMYSGLQLGVVDGLDHVATSVKSMNFYDHVKYMSDVKLFASPMFLVISKPLYEKLPDEYKAVLDEGMNRALKELKDAANVVNTEDIKYLQDECGMENVDCNVDAIHEVVAPIREKYMMELEPWVQDVAKKIMEIQ